MFIKLTRLFPLTFLPLTLFVCLITGCEDNTGPESISAGEVIGLVQPFDQWERQVSDKSGINVVLKGTNITDITAKSGNYGRYKLTGVEPGVYTITITKKGYGMMKHPFYQFYGNGEDFVLNGRPLPLGKIPDYNVRLDTVFVRQGFNGKKITIEGSLLVSSRPGIASVVTYMAKSADIDPEDASSYLAVAAGISFPGTTFYGGAFDLPAVEPGTLLYFQSFPIATTTLFYPDPSAETTNQVYCCLGPPTEITSLVVPNDPSSADYYSQNSFTVTIHSKDGTKIKRFKIPIKATSSDIIKLRNQVSDFTSKLIND